MENMNFIEHSSRNCYQEIKDYMLAAPPGTVFAKVDFAGYGEDFNVRKVLSRMVSEGVCKKVFPSVYYRASLPGQEEFGAPDAFDIAYACARNRGWRVVPGPEVSLYQFGFTEEAPEIFEFLTNGNPAVCHVSGCCEIFFKKCCSRWMDDMSPECLPVVTALMGLRKTGLWDSDLMKIGRQLSLVQVRRLEEEKGLLSVWMQECLDVVLSVGKGVDALIADAKSRTNIGGISEREKEKEI